ncbi:MAG: hypothetical protein ACFFCO_05815 [Promethearchaeota archaeon]
MVSGNAEQLSAPATVDGLEAPRGLSTLAENPTSFPARSDAHFCKGVDCYAPLTSASTFFSALVYYILFPLVVGLPLGQCFNPFPRLWDT